MADLAEQVAAWEHDTTVAGLSSKQRQRVYIPLYQTHLPKLDEAGLIEYDQRRGDIVPKEQLHQVTPYLPPEDGVTEERELPAGEGADDPNGSTAYFGGMSVVGTGLVAAAWTGLVALPGIAVGTIVTVMFAVATFGIGRW